MDIRNLLERTRQSLYHATSMDHAFSILQGNIIKGNTKQKTKKGLIAGVSLTREKSFALDWNGVIFELDWDALRHNHKISPIDFKHHSPHFKVKRRFASEEFLEGDIENLRKYLVKVIFRVDYKDEDFEDLTHELDKEGIPYTVD